MQLIASFTKRKLFCLNNPSKIQVKHSLGAQINGKAMKSIITSKRKIKSKERVLNLTLLRLVFKCFGNSEVTIDWLVNCRMLCELPVSKMEEVLMAPSCFTKGSLIAEKAC